MSDHIAAAAVLIALALPGTAGAQDWRSVTYMRQAAGEELLRVDLEYGAGRLDVKPASDRTLYRANLRYDADAFRPVSSYLNGRLRIGVESGRGLRGRNIKSGTLELQLGTGVPLELDLKFGAVEADLDLGGLRIRNAEIATGASQTSLRVSRPNPEVCRLLRLEVGAAQFRASGLANLNVERLTMSGGVGEVVLDFTGEWRADMTADIEMGLGALTLRVPRGLGVRVQKGGILAGFDSQGLTKQGEAFFSDDWDGADHRLTINVDAALGSIRMVWVDSGADR
jgi:hypothetical protein